MTGTRPVPALVALSLLAGIVAATAATPSRAAEKAGAPRSLLEATPLVLKDGRMAYVSVHVLPFEPGAETLAGTAAEGLAGLAERLATDCFLTAQALGHVEPGAAGEGEDTIASHRLARARAEGVQKALAGKGLPASTVASVWDWQFLVRAPRVTLWVFRLREGEDCKGLPLAPAKGPAVAQAGDGKKAAAGGKRKAKPAPDAVARVEPPPAAAATPSPAPVAEARVAPVAAETAALPLAEATAARDGDTARVAAPVAATIAAGPPPPSETTVPSTRVAAREEAPAGPSTVAPGRASGPASSAAAAATPGPLPVRPAGEAAVAATPEVEAPVAATPSPEQQELVTASVDASAATAAVEPEAAPPAGAAAADGTALEIVFDTNSSYFPRGAGGELKRLLDGLPRAGGYEFELSAAVGAADTGAKGGPAEAARYDRWLAERRLARVADWIEKNAPSRRVTLRRGLLEDDASRRVVVRARPMP